MFFGSKTKKAKKAVEMKIRECNMYLDNNYRDLAKSSYAEIKQLIDEKSAAGELGQREISELMQQVNKCSMRIDHMGHY